MLYSSQIGKVERVLIRLIVIAALFLAGPGATHEFWVVPGGNDANAGTQAQPFGTLERARDAVRQLKQDTRRFGGGITIYLRAGDYSRTNALELNAADSGSPESPIIWRAYKDEPVRLLGGRKL